MKPPVHPQDLLALIRRLAARGSEGPLWALLGGEKRRVAEAWSHTASRASHWWDVGEVRARWNERITGDPRVSVPDYVAEKYLSDRCRLSALSLGCGTGEREIAWAKTGKFGRIDAVDLSATRIEAARARAAAEGCSGVLNFSIADARTLPANTVHDVVFAEGILHHLTPLDEAIGIIRRSLTVGGLLFVDEFVGPRRFQWTERQLKAVNALLALVPESCRRRSIDGTVKKRVHRPGWLSMWISDPSEGADSDRIVQLLRQEFEILELKEYGGPVLHLLLKDIAHNFSPHNPHSLAWLNICFAAEDLLLESGYLKSDFVFAACRKL